MSAAPPGNIYWMRHGDTEVPTTRTSGDFDTPLSDLGREQVHTNALALRDRGIFPKVIISSQMPRAVQSAEIVAEVFGRNVVVADGPILNEQDWAGERPESPEALARRAVRISRRLHVYTSVLVVAHGQLGKAVARVYQGSGIDSPVPNINHGQIIRLQPSPVVWL